MYDEGNEWSMVLLLSCLLMSRLVEVVKVVVDRLILPSPFVPFWKGRATKKSSQTTSPEMTPDFNNSISLFTLALAVVSKAS